METIKVNMTPCEDVKTIHASQNDNEAREWGFELHNNGELIDTSEVTDQIVFKAYECGTEQILPENGSTPTTSPFLGDIKYPQGLLTNQEFIYRQSPTESDGLAKIQTIYGNTLKWNQLINDTGSTTTTNGITFTKNADGSITLNGTATAQAQYNFARIDFINGHKYLINGIPSGATEDGYRAFLFQRNVTANRILTPSIDDWFTPRIRVSEGVTVSNVVFRLNIFDLTKMFGQGNEPSTVEEFMSFFPLYYSYDSGSLLSFRGNGLKTVGKNLLDKTSFSESSNARPEQTSTGVKVISKNGVSYGNVGTVVISNLAPFIGKTFILSADVQTSNRPGLALQVRDENNVEKAWRSTNVTGSTSVTLTITDDFRGCRLRVVIYAMGGSGVVGDYSIYDDLQLEFGTSATSYEPYAENTTSLPISTYFPTGMKSAGTVYDELTESKAITRIGVLDLDSVNWSLTSNRATTGALSGVAKTVATAEVPNMLSPKYEAVKAQATLQAGQYAFFNGGSNTWILSFYYDGANKPTGLLYYELATPIETSITTASLVTENAEIPLSNNDGTLIGKCTEELSAEPGFHDAKIKLADEDGECYSNKIQLHVERKPS